MKGTVLMPETGTSPAEHKMVLVCLVYNDSPNFTEELLTPESNKVLLHAVLLIFTIKIV